MQRGTYLLPIPDNTLFNLGSRAALLVQALTVPGLRRVRCGPSKPAIAKFQVISVQILYNTNHGTASR